MRSGTELAGRYRLEGLLGQGAMGQVWRALDTTMRRPVAIKLLPGHHASDPWLLDRLRRECWTVAGIRHEGIAAAYDMGEDGDIVFFVMELLEGEDLQRVMGRYPSGMHVGRALLVAERTAEALAAAHAQRIVHRDVKPGNLMILPGDLVKVCDFGIARFAQSAEATAESTTVGTPAYMAPEQCAGEAVDGRTDLYALGCVLYAMLTGRPPFTGDTVAEIINGHLTGRVVPPRAIRPELPASVEALVLSLLAKHPGDRPGDALSVAGTLHDIRTGRAVEIDLPPEPAAGPPSSAFTLDVFQNEFLPLGTDQANAIVTVTCDTAGARVPVSVVFVVGCSSHAPAVRDAVADAIDLLGEGDCFAVIEGSETTDMLYPRTSRLVVATPAAKAEARRALALLQPAEHAAFGYWMRHAVSLKAVRPTLIRHVVLLTDMTGDIDIDADLRATFAASGGAHSCDVRGIGTDWTVAQLRRVAEILNGTIDIVADPAGLRADLAEIVGGVQERAVPGLALRLRVPRTASVDFVKQVAPQVSDMTGKGEAAGEGVTDWPLAPWGPESRDFHVALRMLPGGPGEERLVARVQVVERGEQGDVLAEGRIIAIWTDDDDLSVRISPQVAHYTGQAELARAIQEGLLRRADRRDPGAW